MGGADQGRLWIAVDATRMVVHGPAHLDYGGLYRLNGSAGAVEQLAEYDGSPYPGTSLVHDGQRLWLSWLLPNLDDAYAPGRNVLHEVDPDTLEIVTTTELPQQAGDDVAYQGMTLTDGALWIAGDDAGTGYLIKVDLSTREAARMPLGSAPTAIAYDGASLWVADQEADLLHRVDPVAMAAVGEPVRTGSMPSDVAVGAGAVWVRHIAEDAIARIPLPPAP